MAPPQFCTCTVYKRLLGSGPAEAAEEESFGPEIQQRDGVRMVEEPLVYLCQPKQGAKAQGEERRGGEELMRSDGWRKGCRGCLYIGGGEGWGACPRASRRRPQTLGFGAHGPAPLGWSMWLLFPMGPIWPIRWYNAN